MTKWFITTIVALSISLAPAMASASMAEVQTQLEFVETLEGLGYLSVDERNEVASALAGEMAVLSAETKIQWPLVLWSVSGLIASILGGLAALVKVDRNFAARATVKAT